MQNKIVAEKFIKFFSIIKQYCISMKTVMKEKTLYKKNYAVILQNVFQKNQTFDQNKKNVKSF